MKNKILIVGMINSIHLSRWIEHLYNYKNLEVYVFPIFPVKPHPLLKKISNLNKRYSNIKILDFFPHNFLNYYFHKIFYFLFKDSFTLYWLKKCINSINPKYVHSHELTTSSIMCLKLKEKLKEKFPKWIVSNWGSDLYFFYKVPFFKKNLNQILKHANFYSAECYRDYLLAKKIGIKAKFLDCVLNSGGIDIKKIEVKKRYIKPSKRKLIMIKGYQGLLGMGLYAIKALESISNELRDFKIVIYSADKEVISYYKKIKNKLKLSIDIFPINHNLDQSQMYKYFSKARIYLGISRSDGVSTSLLEAMALGTFPIQSSTSCADEWIKNGKSGFLVKNNISIISQKLLKALKDDNLVNNASKINLNTIKKKANSKKVRAIIRNFYK